MKYSLNACVVLFGWDSLCLHCSACVIFLKTVLHNFLTFLFSLKQDPGGLRGFFPFGRVVFRVKYGSLTLVFNPCLTL